jgi:hypothetical protein
MKEHGSPILIKNTSGTATLRNQADNADLILGNDPAPHAHDLATGAIDVTATKTELNYVSGVTSAIQTQISGKEPKITTQTDQSASRADGTVYQNTTGRALFCSVSFNDDVGRLATAYSDASNPPTTIVAKATSSGNDFMQLFFIVLPGNRYKVVFSNPPTTLIWVEWS